jgi:hypothetical protein
MMMVTKTTESETESPFGELLWSELLKLTGRGKDDKGQGNYRQANGDRQGGYYFPVEPMEKAGVPQLIRVSVTMATEAEVKALVAEMTAAATANIEALLTGNGNHNGNGYGSGRA